MIVRLTSSHTTFLNEAFEDDGASQMRWSGFEILYKRSRRPLGALEPKTWELLLKLLVGCFLCWGNWWSDVE